MSVDKGRLAANAINHVMGEMFDSYLGIGYMHGTGEAIVIAHIPDTKSQVAVMALLGSIATRGLPIGKMNKDGDFEGQSKDTEE